MKDHADLDARDFGHVHEHDWTLVEAWATGIRSGRMNDPEQLLWACPCGEFKWTSYADWEKGEKARKFLSDTNDQAEQMVSAGLERLRHTTNP